MTKQNLTEDDLPTGLKRQEDSSDKKTFWDKAEKTAEEVVKWPSWKRGEELRSSDEATGPTPGYTAVDGGEVDAEGHFHAYVTEEDVANTYRMWARRLTAAGGIAVYVGEVRRLAHYLREQGIQLPPESVTEEVDGE